MTDFRLHHIGIVVPEIADAVEVYRQRFGYEVRSALIHDPVQTAYIQFVALPNDDNYLEFVSPDGDGSKLANALKKGGGLNHVCYSTSDISSACEELRTRGMFLIQAPVAAAAFPGRRIAWLVGKERSLVELVERNPDGGL